MGVSRDGGPKRGAAQGIPVNFWAVFPFSSASCRVFRQVIRTLFDAFGGSAIYAHRNPFDRWLRDAETWCQHVAVQRKALVMIGGMLLKSDDFQSFPLL